MPLHMLACAVVPSVNSVYHQYIWGQETLVNC